MKAALCVTAKLDCQCRSGSKPVILEWRSGVHPVGWTGEVAHRSAGAARWQARSRERVFKGGLEARSPAEKREYVRHCRPHGLSVAEGCRLMGARTLDLLRRDQGPTNRGGSANSANHRNLCRVPAVRL